MSTSVYEDETYARKNKTWHIEDSPWKATQVLRLITSNDLELGGCAICEVGCGAGEILVQLYRQLPAGCTFIGYDISPQLEDMWKQRENDRIRFIRKDFLTTSAFYELLLFVDIIEHIEDYIGFLRKIKYRGKYKVFNFPLELFAVKALLGHKYLDSRAKYGHIHYFNKDICLSVLKELDFEIIDYFYAPGAIDLSSTSTSISTLSKIAKFPRILLSNVSTDLTAKLLGGYSLFILAK
ncbi:MAG: class I SAM-dependent methyltransferase [Halobacteriota archaeon]